MSLERLLDDTAKKQFVADFYLKQPFSQPTGAKSLVELGSWETVRSVLAGEGVDAMLAREGRLWDGETLPNYDEVRRLHSDGWTLVIRHAERHDARLKELADGFEADFLAPVNIHVYCTPKDQFGFGWHYDAEDVFIVQTEGGKEYSLRKNTVNPWPLVETIPADMRYDREIMPVMKCQLEAGDWLYIPPGYWHMGQSRQAAISLAVGVMSTSALDMLDGLRARLLDSLIWRQRLPAAGNAAMCDDEELLQQYQRVFAELAEDLSRRLRDASFVRSFLRRKRDGHG